MRVKTEGMHEERLCDGMKKFSSVLLGLLLAASFPLAGCQWGTGAEAAASSAAAEASAPQAEGKRSQRNQSRLRTV